MITAYDAPGAAMAYNAGIDLFLVGDSVAMTMLGFDSTLPVTMEDMLHHTRAVRRGAPDAFVVFDMPFMSYQCSISEAMHNAGLAIKQGGADAVKLEGGAEHKELVRRLTGAGIPVMPHLGLLPQHVQTLGGYRVSGKGEDAKRLVADALELEAAGAFAIVLECVPQETGKMVTEALHIPTIGIGAGPECSGQIQVFHDVVGLCGDFIPRHSRRYVDAGSIIRNALAEYASDVRSGTFPAPENCFKDK